MPRIILLTDFSEAYANSLLKGIVRYSKGGASWVLCKMPQTYRERYGLKGVLEWALKWKADGIIAQFYNSDDVGLFRRHGIAAVAQDFKKRFTEIPNITGAHLRAGEMGARYFLNKGFKEFAFYGFPDIVWSEERCEGFCREIARMGYAGHCAVYQNIASYDLWFYESAALMQWLRELPKPVAIMACDDNQGHYIIEVCNQCGIRIPQEAAVLGVDNDEIICTLSEPSLSSVQQNVEQGGYDTAALLEAMIQNPDGYFADVVVEPSYIVTRLSTDIYASKDPYIAAAIEYIHRNSERNLHVEEIVRQIPLSRRLLETRFRDITGSSVYAYVLKVRIDKFADKLIESNDPIIEIALELGFSDYKNISRQFKNLKGCTPSEFRAGKEPPQETYYRFKR